MDSILRTIEPLFVHCGVSVDWTWTGQLGLLHHARMQRGEVLQCDSVQRGSRLDWSLHLLHSLLRLVRSDRPVGRWLN